MKGAWWSHGCGRNVAGREEDCGAQITYVPCRRPAIGWIATRGDDLLLCEEHAAEARSDGSYIEEME